mmetsp:Transcript_10748/g.16855  ORF Transcript_10748/g.16855 Transcript_10748/m.16855 type:complete len:124 (+) Transcript_10748:1449-1820(+)
MDTATMVKQLQSVVLRQQNTIEKLIQRWDRKDEQTQMIHLKVEDEPLQDQSNQEPNEPGIEAKPDSEEFLAQMQQLISRRNFQVDAGIHLHQERRRDSHSAIEYSLRPHRSESQPSSGSRDQL